MSLARQDWLSKSLVGQDWEARHLASHSLGYQILANLG